MKIKRLKRPNSLTFDIFADKHPVDALPAVPLGAPEQRGVAVLVGGVEGLRGEVLPLEHELGRHRGRVLQHQMEQVLSGRLELGVELDELLGMLVLKEVLHQGVLKRDQFVLFR